MFAIISGVEYTRVDLESSPQNNFDSTSRDADYSDGTNVSKVCSF